MRIDFPKTAMRGQLDANEEVEKSQRWTKRTMIALRGISFVNSVKLM